MSALQILALALAVTALALSAVSVIYSIRGLRALRRSEEMEDELWRKRAVRTAKLPSVTRPPRN